MYLIEEHIYLKTEAVKLQMAMRDFLHDLLLKGMQEYRKAEFKKRVYDGFQDSYEGKGRSISLDELEEMERKLENDDRI